MIADYLNARKIVTWKIKTKWVSLSRQQLYIMWQFEDE